MFRKFPYTNFHDLNLDWLIKRVRELADEFIKLNGNFENLETGVEEFKTFMLNDFQELKDYVDNFIDSVDFEKIVSDKLDEMEESGELEQIIQEALDNLITMPTILNMNRLGTVYKDWEKVAYSSGQGLTVVDETHAYRYYASWDGYDNGELVYFNPITNEQYNSIVLNARHGQSLTHNNEKVFVLNYLRSTEDTATNQYITVVNRSDLSNARKPIRFNNQVYSIWGITYDSYTNKLFAGATIPNSDFTRFSLLELQENIDNFSIVNAVELEKANTSQGCIDIEVDEKFIYTLNASRCITVYYKENEQLKCVVNLPKTTQDYFKLEEMEGLSILENGDIYIGVLSVITQETTEGNRSGVYLNTLAKSNIYRNVAKRTTAFDNLIAREELINVYVNSSSSDKYACIGSGGDSVNALDTIYKALMYDFDNRSYRITLRPNHIETIKTLNITNRENIIIANDSSNFKVNDIRVLTSNNIRLYRVGDSSTTATVDTSNDIIIAQSTLDELNVSNSYIKLYSSDANTFNINSWSEVENNQPLDFSKFTNIVPTNTSFNFTKNTPTIDTNGVATGFMINKLTNRRGLLLGLTFSYNNVLQYARALITALSNSWYQDVATADGTFKVKLKIVNNQLYIESISNGVQISTVKDVLVNSII